MKRNRLLACVLAAAMVLSLTVVPAMAAYPDVPADNWAAKYVNDMTQKGIFTGISEGGQILFKPDKPMTAVEALALCARISVETALRQEIGRDRADQIAGLTGDAAYWARDEFATCIEAGILSYAELKELWQSGEISKPIAKEDFALYLVRSMQLAPMAENLSTYTLDFTDKKDITAGMEPYVYLLNTYGIVTGNENKAFAPKSTVTRAVAATMLSRAIDFMDESGTSVELPEYTDYNWEAGIIVSAAAGAKDKINLVLKSDISGDKTISIPAATPIYENSMLVESKLLVNGTYARVCFDQDGTPMAIRLSGSVETVAGSVVGVSDSTLLLNVNGTTQSVNYDRFTEVQVGGKTGDRSLIDAEAGYTDAVCRIDQLGHLVAVQLTGGTRREEGVIKSVETQASGGAVLVISGLDGQLQRLTVPAGTTITANGLSLSSLDASHVGNYVDLRVSNDDGTVSSAAMDRVTRYVQGAVRSTGSAGGVDNVTVSDLSTNKATTYNLAETAEIYYSGKAVGLGAIQKDWFVTVRVTGGEITALYGYPGSKVTEGTIAGIDYPSSDTAKMVLSVSTAQGAVVTFDLSLSDPPSVQRSGKSAGLSKLRTGDSVTVTSRYNEVTLIDSVPRSANVSGTIVGKSETKTSYTIDVELDNGGGTKTYELNGSISVTRDDKIIDVSELAVDYHVAMITEGDEVLSIDVDRAAGSNATKISGTVITVESKEKTILFRTSDEKIVTVDVPAGLSIQTVGSGTISLSKLQNGDNLDIYGEYKDGNFKASVIIKI